MFSPERPNRQRVDKHTHISPTATRIRRRHYQSFDILATRRDALLVQLIAQHSGTHERMFQIQFIQSPHDVQITLRDGFGQIIDATPADMSKSAWRLIDSFEARSIIALRSAIPPC